MPNYQYKAVDKAGNRKKGTVTADNLDKAMMVIRGQALTPVSVKEETLLTKDWAFDVAPKTKTISMLFKQFASLLRAGASLTETLDMLVDTIPKKEKTLQKAVQGTKQAVQKGDSLAGAMSQYPKCFDTMSVSMVAAGEESGTLDVTFDRVATQMDKSSAISSAIKNAMVYPAIVCVVAVVVIIVLLVFVVPSFMSMFDDMDMEMPGITMAVVALSNFVKNNIFIILLVVAALAVIITAFKKSEMGSNLLAWLAIKLPVIGDFTVKGQASKFARTLGTMQSSGLTLTNSLEITADVMTNLKFKQATAKVRDLVLTGVPLAEAMEAQKIYPVMLTRMISIGEKTGDLPGMLEKTADYFDEQTENATAALMNAMSPAVIIGLLVIVGPILLAVLAPMLKLYSGLGDGL